MMIEPILKTILFPVSASFWLAGTAIRLSWVGGKFAYGCFQEQPEQEGAFFFKEKHLKKRGYLDPTESFYVGHLENRFMGHTRRVRVFTHRDRSAILVGVPGLGKSSTIVANIRAIALWDKALRPDLLVTDPANGEILAGTREQLEGMGYRIAVIDLTSPKTSTRYDPLTILRPGADGFDREVSRFCELLIPESGDGRNNHFTEFSRLWVGAVISYMMRHDPDNATFQKCLGKATCEGKERDALLDALLTDYDPIVQLGARAYKNVGDRERGSYMSTMARSIRTFMYQEIRTVSEPGKSEDGKLLRGWTFEEAFDAKQPTAFFIRSGLDGGTTGAYVRLLLGNAINTRRRMLGKGFKFTKGLRIFVDEAKMVGNCTALLDANNELRKAKVRIFLCYLSRAHIFECFSSGDAKALLDTCSLILGGQSQDYESYVAQSRTIGETRLPGEIHWNPLARPEELRQQEEEWTVTLDGGQVQLKKPYWDKGGQRWY